MSPLTLALLVAGFLLLYGAIKNLNPLDVVKNALSGKPIGDARALK